MIIAITSYHKLTKQDSINYCEIEPYIDYLIVRSPMCTSETIEWINQLKQRHFPKDKIIIHSDYHVLQSCDLSRIHFRENDEQIRALKQHCSNIKISMSTHNRQAIQCAEDLNLDFVLYGHVFETKSKKGLAPKSLTEVNDALKSDIPVVALGGINLKTVSHLPKGFQGIAGISIFNHSIKTVQALHRAWLNYEVT
ncbi:MULTISPECIES: thiamine phosphate synthase [Staphylococcus]|uniref:Thiamine phosphate synthase n=1 Tax=Staphylococcus cohnii TaxID=29382 RepID=A0A2T4LQU5_9STAP|nr:MULTISPECIES: thiamine phosphate synthase [Staphylococcus]MBA1353157.1 thiamine phosphate synthase [Staphylococcus cohnii]MBA1389889.1 thiamine phosphate synthase [Staphylococcus cohnii]MCE5033428.1 thiamine phosphate synthase [Staphylococcus cohnii]MSU30695.1 thiamine phosphate synthase [Staphylococcus sp. McC-251-APC-3A2]PTE76581.1 thiamine phosphate synthase [Staphylococcus cohnii]